MSILVLDAGNTRLLAALAGGAENAARWPEPAPLLTELGERAAAADPGLGPWLARLLRAVRPQQTVMVSVVPAVAAAVRAAHAQTLVVDHTAALPFALAVDDPAAVGADRLCNVAAARAAGLSDALIVDAGTATTFDVLRDGVFLGGLIAPGMAFAARRLGEEAARLEPVPFGPSPLEAGASTAAAMAGGAWHVGVGGVGHVVAGLRRRYGDPPVVVTGGLGGYLAELGAHDPHWTLRGAMSLIPSA